jgi:colicin import membrane protein
LNWPYSPESKSTDVVTISPFEKTKEDLILFVADYKNLVVNDETFEESKKARIVLRDMRYRIQATEKKNTEKLNELKNFNWERSKELIEILTPVESNIDDGIKAIEKRKAEIKAQKEREENERIQQRVNSLLNFGHIISFHDAKAMPEEDYQALLGHAEAEWIKEQEAIAQAKAEEEKQRLAELERVRLEREEFDRQKAEFAKREQELKVLREKELQEQRDREAKIKAEQDRKEAELKAEREKLEAEKRAIELEKSKGEAAERARIEAENKVKREAEEKVERERQAEIEAKRQEALKPDKDKILTYLNSLDQMPGPDVSQDESKVFMKLVYTNLDLLVARFRREVETLK